MSYEEMYNIRVTLNDLNTRLTEATNLLNDVSNRLAYLENTRVTAIENEQVSMYKKITEDMHDSLVAISRASTDAMRANMLADMHVCAAEMIAKHQTIMHPSYTATVSGSAAEGSS